jgi:hypothetical protein
MTSSNLGDDLKLLLNFLSRIWKELQDLDSAKTGSKFSPTPGVTTKPVLIKFSSYFKISLE